jgi:hypothetical protein
MNLIWNLYTFKRMFRTTFTLNSRKFFFEYRTNLEKSPRILMIVHEILILHYSIDPQVNEKSLSVALVLEEIFHPLFLLK